MKNRKLTIPAALMLMLLAVVCTFNITFFVATEEPVTDTPEVCKTVP